MNATLTNKTRRISAAATAAALTLAIIPLFGTAAPSEAQRYRRPARRSGQLVRLGSKNVDGRRDSDTIEVDVPGRFRQVQFRVTQDDARISKVVVHFENGQRYRVRVNQVFRQGQRSAPIDLPGYARDIDRVTFRYSALRGADDEAEVVLFGIR